MKKNLLFLIMLLTSWVAQAQKTTYTDQLVVTINDESTPPQEATIEFEETEEGLYNLSLQNFVLGAGEDVIPVGNINLNNLTVTKSATGKLFISTTQTIQIVEGDLEGMDYWMGPMLGDVPVALKGWAHEGKMLVEIDIDMMSSLQQIIEVTFGTVPTFTDNLVVTINEESTEPQAATIEFNEMEEGQFTLSLKNFVLGAGEDILPVGNINLTGLQVTPLAAGKLQISTTQTIQIAAGNLEGIDFWMGPMLGDVPVILNGVVDGERMHVQIDIDMMSSIQQIIEVTFGSCTLDQPEAIEFATTHVGNSTTQSVTLGGSCLAGEITLSLVADEENAAFFTLDKTTATAGETITITYAPTAEGTHSATVTLAAEGAEEVSFVVGGHGIKAQIESDQTALAFGEVEYGQTKSLTFTVTGSQLFEEIALALPAESAFTLSSYTASEGATEITVTFTPNAESAVVAETLTLSSAYAEEVTITLTASAIPSSISNTTATNGLVNVYTLEGVLVRQQVAAKRALAGLEKGIYIVNGKKLIK